MPIYEYQCLLCNHIFENLIFPGRIKKVNIDCPECGAIEIAMLPSMIGLAMHNTEMITPRDGYKVRRKTKEDKNGQENKEKS